MSYHILILNETKKEHLDLGKYLHDYKVFQMPAEVIAEYLFKHQGDSIKIVDDGQDYDEYPEVDCWTNYLPPCPFDSKEK